MYIVAPLFSWLREACMYMLDAEASRCARDRVQACCTYTHAGGLQALINGALRRHLPGGVARAAPMPRGSLGVANSTILASTHLPGGAPRTSLSARPGASKPSPLPPSPGLGGTCRYP